MTQAASLGSGAKVVRRGSAEYPSLLEQIHDPPARLHVRGRGDRLCDGHCVAIVGARRCSAYGRHVARAIGREVSRAGAVVVSGLARGIDGEAHQGALEAGGRTVAVLGSGLDHVYPAAHRTLARRIEETGLLVTEYPPATRPAPWRFPARNRIIAGLARAVVVVQARARSGALITADFALENGRDVMAVPGEITSELSSGTNQLLLHGASPVTAIRDVLEALDIAAVEARCDVRLGNVQRSIVARLGEEPASLDELAAELELAPGSLAATLAELELRAVVEEEAGTYRALPTA